MKQRGHSTAVQAAAPTADEISGGQVATSCSTEYGDRFGGITPNRPAAFNGGIAFLTGDVKSPHFY